jgi:mannose-6-phosphate isomerase-like protein (cupin superfamily)
VGYAVFRADELDWDEPTGGDPRRRIVRLSDAMANMRANLWRLPPDTRGRRHIEFVQEEVFAVLEGTATLMLGDPPERIDLACGSVAIVQPRTPLQVRNASDVDTVVLIVGAPPVPGEAEYLPDPDSASY